MARESKKTAIYSLPRDSVVWRVVDYLHLHKTEMLNRHDVAVKFETDASTVDSVLAMAVDAGLLKRARDSENVIVWRRPQRVRNQFATPFANGVRSTARLDISTIKIEHDIPIADPVARGGQWKALFDRMKPGDSFQVPTAAYAALAHARQEYSRADRSASFVVRKLSAEFTRIWRTA